MEQKNSNEKMISVSVASERAEAIGGVLIALFAALLAIADLVNNNLEEEMMIAHNKQNSYFSWYQSKSIKQSLKESELATLEALSLQGNAAAFEQKIVEIKEEIGKYKKEKNEILVGSANIPKEDWVQDLDGEMGKIIGVNEWELSADKLDKATQKFDMAMLFFQLSLVMGAVCVIIYDNPKLQRNFIRIMIVCGILGISLATWGYLLSI